MSRFINHQEMPAADLIRCSYEVQAIISLCRCVADDLPAGQAGKLGSDIGVALGLAYDLMEPLHEALELHEGLTRPTFKEAAE